LTYANAKGLIPRHGLVPTPDLQALPSSMTRTQFAEWLYKRSPPLSDTQILEILAEFDKP
jgi:hypothetical protein